MNERCNEYLHEPDVLPPLIYSFDFHWLKLLCIRIYVLSKNQNKSDKLVFIDVPPAWLVKHFDMKADNIATILS